MRKIVITGMGCIAAPGIGVAAFEAAIMNGVSGRKALTGGRLGPLKIGHAATVPGYDPAAYFDRRQLAGLDPFAQYALVAAAEAVAMSGIHEAVLAGSDTAVILGTGIGGATTTDDGTFAVYGGEDKRMDVMSVPRLMPSAAASQVSMRYRTQGPSFAVTSACASATQAIGLGLMMVRSGLVERALVGGSEACITYSGMRAWEALRVLTPDLCRPFSLGRNGMMLGEGAAIFVIETEAAALARGAAILATLDGYGTTSDGMDILRPNQAGCAQAMRLALADAGIDPSAIGYINAHGTGTIANDLTESAAIVEVFGERGAGIPVSSTKPVHGHTLGAAGAIELVSSVLALQRQKLPPNINMIEQDPACPIEVVLGEAQATTLDYALSNSFAFGGVNASLVVGRPRAA